jgi:hypothetical protein
MNTQRGTDEILAVKHIDDLEISVSLNASKIIKNSGLYGPMLLKQSIELKFVKLIDQVGGHSPTKLTNYKIGGHMYMYKTFDYDGGNANGYYEYGGLYIKDPEEYYEVYISGNKSKQTEHREIVNQFLESLIDYHFKEN